MENQIIGLVIKDNEKQELRKICLKYGLPILYEEVFEDGLPHYLWAFNKNGIALIGTYIIQRLPLVLHGLKEFEDYLANR